MTDETEIKTKDLLFYPSSLLTQDEDGGGDLVKTPLTDATSEVFDPTSSVQKVNGGFTARLVYPAVLTEGREKLLGSFCAVSRIPDQENEDVLLFAGDYYGEKWKNAKNRIEAYSVPTIFSKYTLLGYANKGSKQIQCYCRADEAEPLVGECYCFRLRLNKDTLEYFRVEAVSSEIRRFDDESGTFEKKVIKITTTDILNAEWEGLDYPVRGKAQPTTMIYETHISNASHYYGVASITQNVNQGEKNIKVNRIYGQLVPCTTINQAHGDQYPAANNFYLPLGRNISATPQNNKDFYAPHGLLPQSITHRGQTDNGKGELNYGTSTYTINYADGIIYQLQNYSVIAQEAVLASNAAYSTFIEIDQTNQQSEWAIFLDPYPARGSVHISWLSGGMWFDLAETGDRVLRDAFGDEKGRVSRDGSVIFSLPDLPDAYSQIVIFWSPEEFFKNFKDGDLEAQVVAENINSDYFAIFKENEFRPIVPNTVKIIDGSRTTTDDGNGNLVGHLTGTVEYAEGRINVKGLTNANVKVQCKRYQHNITVKEVSPSLENGFTYFRCGKQLQRGSFSAILIVKGITTTETTTSTTIYNPIIQTSDFTRSHRGQVYAVEKRNKLLGYNAEAGGTSTSISSNTHGLQVNVLVDDGNGGLLLDGEPIEGFIDYLTGIVYSNLKIPEPAPVPTITQSYAMSM